MSCFTWKKLSFLNDACTGAKTQNRIARRLSGFSRTLNCATTAIGFRKLRMGNFPSLYRQNRNYGILITTTRVFPRLFTMGVDSRYKSKASNRALPHRCYAKSSDILCRHNFLIHSKVRASLKRRGYVRDTVSIILLESPAVEMLSNRADATNQLASICHSASLHYFHKIAQL